MRRPRSEPQPCVRATNPDFDSAPTLPGGNRLSAMPHRCNSRQSNIGWPGDLRRYSDAARRRAVQDSNGGVGRVATEIVNGHQPAADNARAEVHAIRRKQGSIRRGVKFGEYSLVRIRRSRRVGAEGEIENCRVLWKARTAAQDLRKRQIVGPDKCHAIMKSLELFLDCLTPKLAELSRAHHHEHLPGFGQHLQDVVDEPGKSLTTATAVSFSPSGASPRYR